MESLEQAEQKKVPPEWFVAVKKPWDPGISSIVYSKAFRSLGGGRVGELLKDYERYKEVLKNQSSKESAMRLKQGASIKIEEIEKEIEKITGFSFKEISERRSGLSTGLLRWPPENVKCEIQIVSSPDED